ncbi:MAG: glycerophosphodiester phosphodiesterase [Flavobacteriaceae bacterium]|jgi:glycerophosphoryl diester phosphodiesterase|nr:glycerophosphodiester phosphodiesterase [Flavobacteriaceae bacterium]
MIFLSKQGFIKFIISLYMVSFSALSCNESYQPYIIGHRGAKGHVAENTLPSVAKAIELGVDGIEIDVFLCQSGELVVFHDKTLEKLTDSQGYIEDLPLDTIRKINVLGEYKIPTLEQVLELIDGKVFLNIELKGGGTAEPTHKLLTAVLKQKKWRADQFIISSFNWEELKLFYGLNQEVPIAVLTNADPLDALPIAQEVNAQAINPNFKALNEKNVKKIQQAGYKVFPYTINNPKDIQKMMFLKVDGIITDYPERVNEALSAD